MNRIVINGQLCKGCGFCAAYCPKGLIRIGGEFNSMGYKIAESQDDDAQCTACKICAMMCPDGAINVYAEE